MKAFLGIREPLPGPPPETIFGIDIREHNFARVRSL
jgi:hypothetical protein